MKKRIITTVNISIVLVAMILSLFPSCSSTKKTGGEITAVTEAPVSSSVKQSGSMINASDADEDLWTSIVKQSEEAKLKEAEKERLRLEKEEAERRAVEQRAEAERTRREEAEAERLRLEKEEKTHAEEEARLEAERLAAEEAARKAEEEANNPKFTVIDGAKQEDSITNSVRVMGDSSTSTDLLGENNSSVDTIIISMGSEKNQILKGDTKSSSVPDWLLSPTEREENSKTKDLEVVNIYTEKEVKKAPDTVSADDILALGTEYKAYRNEATPISQMDSSQIKEKAKDLLNVFMPYVLVALGIVFVLLLLKVLLGKLISPKKKKVEVKVEGVEFTSDGSVTVRPGSKVMPLEDGEMNVSEKKKQGKKASPEDQKIKEEPAVHTGEEEEDDELGTPSVTVKKPAWSMAPKKAEPSEEDKMDMVPD